MSEEIKEIVKKTYTEVITNNVGCGCGPSCCTGEESTAVNESYSSLAGYSKEADFGLGCGIPTEFAKIKKGDTVLDLGSGAGNDVFVARSIVGEKGRVIGVDMTEAMIAKANANNKKLGYKNVEFVLCEIENLLLENETIDVAVSNCVLNLVPDKLKAYKELFRVLKPNANFSISDIVLKGDLPKGIRKAAEMYAGCISGALDKTNYLRAIKEAGFRNIKIMKERQIILPDEMLLKFINKNELAKYRESQSAILSITAYAEK